MIIGALMEAVLANFPSEVSGEQVTESSVTERPLENMMRTGSTWP